MAARVPKVVRHSDRATVASPNADLKVASARARLAARSTSGAGYVLPMTMPSDDASSDVAPQKCTNHR